MATGSANLAILIPYLSPHPRTSKFASPSPLTHIHSIPNPNPKLTFSPNRSYRHLIHLFSHHPSHITLLKRMGKGVGETESSYEEALNCLSSLITGRERERIRPTNRATRFDVIFHYLKIFELEGPISQLNVIHVAGTKGKGSTCTFTEAILRNCGFRTGLFTSPHLIDVRERFKLDGVEISEDKFLAYFWWCWERLQEKTKDGVPMPTYFHFLALLGFKIFTAEQVDVAILEVGLGGKFDATNVVKAPIVCGISSLGYDHMEILGCSLSTGYTLGEIAGEKAGIFKQGIPAYTVPQPEEAMTVLKDKASQLGVPLQVTIILDKELLKGHQLGLNGEHQYLNAGLAIALSRTWLQKTGHADSIFLNDTTSLPEQFLRGLTTANLQGRAQIVPDPYGGLDFYLDGAHSPESLEACAKWFSHVIRRGTQLNCEGPTASCNSKQILLFNCMSVRDPQLLLPPLVNICARNGIHFEKALFVPNQSVYNRVGSHATPQSDIQQADLKWQLKLQTIWENLTRAEKGREKVVDSLEGKQIEVLTATEGHENSSVLPSLPLAIKWLRENARQNRSVRFQVLVTGSLHLVGDVLRLIKR